MIAADSALHPVETAHKIVRDFRAARHVALWPFVIFDDMQIHVEYLLACVARSAEFPDHVPEGQVLSLDALPLITTMSMRRDIIGGFRRAGPVWEGTARLSASPVAARHGRGELRLAPVGAPPCADRASGLTLEGRG